jgi:UDP-galactopyranose mutase
MNFTDKETPYTRIIEHKHFEFGTQKGTVISKEYSESWTLDKEPYYPVNDAVNQEKYKKYSDEADMHKNIIFGGRLAEYKYYDMDKVIASALKTAEAEGLLNE